MTQAYSEESEDVRCSACGVPRSPALRGRADRPPCSNVVNGQPCGATALTSNIFLHDTVRVVADELSSTLTPGAQARDWRQRWTLIQSDLQDLQAPRTEPLSSPAIHRQQHALQSFYIQAYHLKDALIQNAPSLGVTKAQIEDAITGDPRLALLADLANLDKHSGLARAPRSGHVPRIGGVAGETHPPDAWRLVLRVEHDTQNLDGLAIAADAVAAWQDALSGWGLA